MDSAAKGHGHGCSRNTKTFTPPCTLLLLVARAPVPLQRGGSHPHPAAAFRVKGQGSHEPRIMRLLLTRQVGRLPEWGVRSKVLAERLPEWGVRSSVANCAGKRSIAAAPQGGSTRWMSAPRSLSQGFPCLKEHPRIIRTRITFFFARAQAGGWVGG